MEQTLLEYQTFLADIGGDLYQPREHSDSFLPEEVKSDYEKALEDLSILLPYEEALEVSYLYSKFQ
ncbi:unnamed protein product [Trichobilharzia regenti]|nr:unnamed protein product [Trichobilharzia regenti]